MTNIDAICDLVELLKMLENKVYLTPKDEDLIKSVEMSINALDFQNKVKDICNTNLLSIEDKFVEICSLVRMSDQVKEKVECHLLVKKLSNLKK